MIAKTCRKNVIRDYQFILRIVNGSSVSASAKQAGFGRGTADGKLHKWLCRADHIETIPGFNAEWGRLGTGIKKMAVKYGRQALDIHLRTDQSIWVKE